MDRTRAPRPLLGPRPFAGILAAAALFAAAETAAAQITRVDLEVVRSPALDGRSFGDAGPYELLRGRFHGEADPDDGHNVRIVDLDLAPRNERGRVEYATTVEIYRPVDMERWNGAIYHTVPNRGGAGAADPALLEMGFALVRVGWQGDIEPTGTNVVASLPVARYPDGEPLVGQALEELIFNDSEPRSTAALGYPAATLDPTRATLTVRQYQDDPRETPDDLSWRYLDERRIEIERPAGFDGGAIYELVYEAKDPIVLGLGFAAVRDAISFLRHESEDAFGNPNPLAGEGPLPRTAISIGISQSGRFLRDLLYQGFNEDLEGRIVFDGIHPDIAGARRTFTNHTFGQPGRWQRQHEDHVFPGDQFPFTYAATFDSIRDAEDGLLERCSRTDTCPRIVQTDGEAELWQARASLLVTDPSGGEVELPENVRVYLIAGTQHGGGAGVHVSTPGPGMCQNPANPLALSQIRLALTIALYEWVEHDVLPPPSRFPRLRDGALVPASELGFPGIPGVAYTGSHNPVRLHDHRVLPPIRGDAYPVFVARVDADGNMMDGVRHPNLEAPIGTHTGWNLRREGFAPGAQCSGTGSFVPFPNTRAEREATGDPRLSLEERYESHDAYVHRIERAADRLVEERFLLRRDAEQIVRLARESPVAAAGN